MRPPQPPPPRLVSRAAALYDEAEALLRARVPLQVMQACEAIAAKGGPAPPPPGMPTPEDLANAAMEAALAVAGVEALSFVNAAAIPLYFFICMRGTHGTSWKPNDGRCWCLGAVLLP
eukprot:scaffold49346_cov17-Tisochrysis_lutea.AAC.1